MSTLSTELGPAVYQRLSKIAKLPAIGIAAGQAVSNAVLEVLGQFGGIGPYRDIDIFVTRDEASQPELRPKGLLNRFARPKWNMLPRADNVYVTQAGWDAEYDILGFQAEHIYSICGNGHQGKLDFIVVQPRGPWRPENLFLGMDLNNGQVGLDLATKRLFWSPAFAEFVRTKELRLTNLRAPASALLRFLSKAEELHGVMADGARAIEEVRLATWQVGRDEYCNPRAYAVPLKLQATLDHFLPLLSRMFKLQDHQDCDGKTVKLLMPTRQPNERSLVILQKYAVHSQHPWALCSSIAAGTATKTQRAVLNVIAPLSSAHPLKEALGVYGLGLIDETVTAEDVQWLVEFWEGRRGVGLHRLTKLSEWVTAARFVEKAEARYGIWVSGAMHAVHSWQVDRLPEARRTYAQTLVTDFLKAEGTSWVAVSQAEFDSHVAQALQVVDQVLHPKLDLQPFSPDAQVEELVTARQLLTMDFELKLVDTPGWYMALYGWGGRFFVIRTANSASLVQIQGLNHVEHRGVHDATPSAEHQALCQELLSQLARSASNEAALRVGQSGVVEMLHV
jgi:hypothetical protein